MNVQGWMWENILEKDAIVGIHISELIKYFKIYWIVKDSPQIHFQVCRKIARRITIQRGYKKTFIWLFEPFAKRNSFPSPLSTEYANIICSKKRSIYFSFCIPTEGIDQTSTAYIHEFLESKYSRCLLINKHLSISFVNNNNPFCTKIGTISKLVFNDKENEKRIGSR